MAMYPLHEETDDDLRAECERRGILMMPANAMVSNEWVRSEYDRRSLVSESHAKMAGNLNHAEHERDEWKRRAEAAEAKESHVATLRERLKDPKFIALVAEKRAALDRADESGPGISAMPARDTSHYVDPLDLLCEDA